MGTLILLLILLGFTSVSCHVGPNNNGGLKKTHNDTIIRDIPERFSTSEYRASNFGQKRNKALNSVLGLDSLQDGFDSLSIRIWIDCGYDISSLIVIERKQHKWNATFYSFKMHHDENLNPKILDIYSVSRPPKSGWEEFSDKLIRTDIINLPDCMNDFSKYSIPTDAYGALVEIGMLKKYRVYEYPELGSNSDIVEGPGKLHQALKLIEREFDYKRPCQDST